MKIVDQYEFTVAFEARLVVIFAFRRRSLVIRQVFSRVNTVRRGKGYIDPER